MAIEGLTQEQVQAAADTVQVHKFGGSSLADAFCYRRVALSLVRQVPPMMFAILGSQALLPAW